MIRAETIRYDAHMEHRTLPRRGFPCWIKSALLLVVCLIVWGGMHTYHNYRATEQAIQSASNLRDIGDALNLYAHDHNGHYPDRLSDLLAESDLGPEMFIVPWGAATPAPGKTWQERAREMDAGGHCSYGYLGAGRTRKNLIDDMVLMYEADGKNPCGFVFCLYGDGHGDADSASDAIAAIVRTLKATPSTQPATLSAIASNSLQSRTYSKRRGNTNNPSITPFPQMKNEARLQSAAISGIPTPEFQPNNRS